MHSRRSLTLSALILVTLVTPALAAGTPPPDPAQACTFRFEPHGATMPQGGSTTQTVLYTEEGCQWTASSEQNWISFSPRSGTGTTYFQVSAAFNSSGIPRAGAVHAGGAYFVVNQHVDLVPPPAPDKVLPSNGAVSLPTTVTLSWFMAFNAQSYDYCIETVNDGICQSGWTDVGMKASVTRTGLKPSTTYYWQVRAANPGGHVHANNGTWWSFTTVPASFGIVNTPSAGSSVVGSRTTIEWVAGATATAYWLDVGSEPGAADLYSNYQDQFSSRTITGLPADGRTVWIRLWSLIGGEWRYADDVSFTSVRPAAARVTSPEEDVVLPGETAVFTWDEGLGATTYWLEIGTSQGSTDLYMAYLDTRRSVAVSGLPRDGRELWVRLYSYIDDQWQFAEDVCYYAAAPQLARLIEPSPGGTLVGGDVTFRWDAGTGVTAYWLDVGSARGSAELYSDYAGASLFATVPNLPIHGSIWARLCSEVRDTWRCTDYEYTAAAYEAARVTTPAPETVLVGKALTFEWTAGRNVSAYWLDVGRALGGYDIFSNYVGTARQWPVSGLPADGRPVWVRLWSLTASGWVFTDHSYTAVSTFIARLVVPARGATLGATTTFAWSRESEVEAYWLDIGTTVGGYDIFSNYVGTDLSRTVTGLPTTGGEIWVRLFSRVTGTWLFVDQVYRAADDSSPLAQLLEPHPGSVLASGDILRWTPGGGTGFWVHFGKSQGGYELGGGNYFTSLFAVVPQFFPEVWFPDGIGALWVRLYSFVDGAWQFIDYTFQPPNARR